MKKIILKVALLACAATAGNVHAIGVAGQGTWETTLLGRDITGKAVAGSDPSAVFLYDTTLNITWLRDANYATTTAYANSDVLGRMNWDAASAWATTLTVGAFGNWRLPSIAAGLDDTFSYAGGTDRGYNVRTKSGNPSEFEPGQTVYSEMAHLWYSTLGNSAACDPAASTTSSCAVPQTSFGLSFVGDFLNVQSRGDYWSGLETMPREDAAWIFAVGVGFQTFSAKSDVLNAMAVRPGDVLTSAVPEPETYALMLAGLGLVGAAARRRKAA